MDICILDGGLALDSLHVAHKALGNTYQDKDCSHMNCQWDSDLKPHSQLVQVLVWEVFEAVGLEAEGVGAVGVLRVEVVLDLLDQPKVELDPQVGLVNRLIGVA